jgi:hypothetical protein
MVFPSTAALSIEVPWSTAGVPPSTSTVSAISPTSSWTLTTASAPTLSSSFSTTGAKPWAEVVTS